MDLSDVKEAIFFRTIVKYKDLKYYATGCTMRLHGSEWYYQLELHDLKINSVIIAKLDDVKFI